MKKRSLLLVFTVGLVASLALAMACGTEEPAPAAPTAAPVPTAAPSTDTDTTMAMEKPVYGGALRFAMNLNCKSLDPAFAQSTCYHDVMYDVFNNLVQIDMEFNILPDLAQSWVVSDDGTAVTFRLVSGARFHDGTDVTAEAVKWHFDRIMSPDVTSPHGSDVGTAIQSVVVNDPLTLTFNLKTPDRSFLSTLTDYPGIIESPTAVLEANSYDDVQGDFGRRPVGSGPFILDSWTPDQSLRIVRNPGYFEPGKPYLDSVNYQHVPDEQARIAMIRTGETDLIGGGAGLFQAKDLPLVEGNPDLNVVTIPRSRMHSIGISTDVEPYSNKDLRAAIAYSIDRASLVDAYFYGAAEPAYSPIAVGWAYNPNIRVYDFDLEKAREALTRAGYPDGIDINFWTRGTTAAIELSEIYQAMLSEAGIRVEIITVNPADYWQSIINRESHMAARWRGARPDPGRFVQQVFHSEGQGNVMGYDGADFGNDVDAMIEHANTVYDVTAAKSLYDEIQQIITEDVAHALTVYTKEFVILNRDVQGFEFLPNLYHKFGSVWMEQ